jgi:hypothetical protein
MDADLKHMRDITANYHQLQGLRLLPWFLWILALSAVNPILGLPPERLDGLCLLLPGVLVSGWLSKRIGNYYVHTFGLVNCAPRSHWHEWLTGILGAFLVCVGFFLDLTGGAPVGLVGLALAVFLPATCVDDRPTSSPLSGNSGFPCRDICAAAVRSRIAEPKMVARELDRPGACGFPLRYLVDHRSVSLPLPGDGGASRRGIFTPAVRRSAWRRSLCTPDRHKSDLHCWRCDRSPAVSPQPEVGARKCGGTGG